MHQHHSTTFCNPGEAHNAHKEEKPQEEQVVSGGAQNPDYAVTFNSPYDDQNPQDWASCKKLRIRTQPTFSQKIKVQENRKKN